MIASNLTNKVRWHDRLISRAAVKVRRFFRNLCLLDSRLAEIRIANNNLKITFRILIYMYLVKFKYS